MKEQSHNQVSSSSAATTRSISNAANLTSLCIDISPSCSTFFEVLYIGKIKVWNKKVPDSFIDDALDRFKMHELEKKATKKKLQNEEGRPRRDSQDSLTSDMEVKSSQSTNSLNDEESSAIDKTMNKSISLQNISSSTTDEQRKLKDNNKLPVDIDDHNRTMVLQVDRTDLRLISPDRKVVLMHKHHKEVTACVQGLIHSEHFGFICREGPNQTTTTTYIGFVFKCESQSVAADAVQAITQAFTNAETRPFRNTITSCEHCPMVWYHKLCSEVEQLSDRKTQAAIFRRYVFVK